MLFHVFSIRTIGGEEPALPDVIPKRPNPDAVAPVQATARQANAITVKTVLYVLFPAKNDIPEPSFADAPQRFLTSACFYIQYE
jgi:hypothetical protein